MPSLKPGKKYRDSMPFSKWNVIEIGLLLLFAVSLYLLYLLLVAANAPVFEIENQFNQSSLRGAITLALNEPGTAIKTKDFNFADRGAISKGSLFDDPSDTPMLCFSLGEKNGGKGFSGGIEEESEQMILFSLESASIRNFTVVCENSKKLIGEIHATSNDSFKAEYFFDCACLEQTGDCCAIALGLN